MTFKENINRLCRAKNTNLTTLIKNCGFSSSKATAINNGQIPAEDQLVILAKALDCHVMDFFADEEDYTFRDKNEEIIIESYRDMSQSQKYRLLAYLYEIKEKGLIE